MQLHFNVRIADNQWSRGLGLSNLHCSLTSAGQSCLVHAHSRKSATNASEHPASDSVADHESTIKSPRDHPLESNRGSGHSSMVWKQTVHIRPDPLATTDKPWSKDKGSVLIMQRSSVLNIGQLYLLLRFLIRDPDCGHPVTARFAADHLWQLRWRSCISRTIVYLIATDDYFDRQRFHSGSEFTESVSILSIAGEIKPHIGNDRLEPSHVQCVFCKRAASASPVHISCANAAHLHVGDDLLVQFEHFFHYIHIALCGYQEGPCVLGN